jgi:DNA-binding transcriptional LysR family regulator
MLYLNIMYCYHAFMEFDDVRAFVSVADTGSISRTARDLYITQSAVTRRLQRLETSLGATLLDRRTRPVMLTGAGQAALERCRRVLNDVREVRAATANSDLPVGEMQIGVAHALTELTLTEPLGGVRHRFPRIALRLITGWSRDLLERVRSGTLDAAVILLAEGERLPAEVGGAQVGKDRLVVVASRREDCPPVRRIQDLAGVQWILNPEGCAARAALRKALLRENIDMAVAVEAYNYELQLALVAQNRGLSLVPERIFIRSRQKSRLRVLRVPGLNFPLTIWTVHRQPLRGLDSVIVELSRELIEKL